jgi:hypothetical protein
MNALRSAAYQIDPVSWAREVLGVTPTAWQETFLRAPRGASILALTARQVGKTTTAAWAIAHAMVFVPGSLSVIACPATIRLGGLYMSEAMQASIQRHSTRGYPRRGSTLPV